MPTLEEVFKALVLAGIIGIAARIVYFILPYLGEWEFAVQDYKDESNRLKKKDEEEVELLSSLFYEFRDEFVTRMLWKILRLLSLLLLSINGLFVLLATTLLFNQHIWRSVFLTCVGVGTFYLIISAGHAANITDSVFFRIVKKAREKCIQNGLHDAHEDQEKHNSSRSNTAGDPRTTIKKADPAKKSFHG